MKTHKTTQTPWLKPGLSALALTCLAPAIGQAQRAPVAATATLSALSPNGLSVTTPNGYAVVVRDDLVLRSEAGELRWGRQWDGQEWRFNPQWESLSQSWKNLTGSQAADTTGATVTAGGTGAGTSSATSGATATLSAGASGGGSGGGCWVWVDEDWQPSYGTALIGGLPQAEPVVPARLTPFNRVMGEVGAEQASYPPLQRVSVDYASLCAGAAVAMPPATDVEAIRRANELYLGDNGRYAFSNRAVLEKRTVRQIAAAAPEALSTSLASGRITLSPQTNDKGFRWIDKSGDWIDYNTQGQVVAYGDRNNNTTWLARDTGGRLLGVVDNRGRVLLTLHYTGQLLTEVKDQPVAGLVGDLPARSVKYAYDSANRLVSVTDARGNVSSYGYNVSNRIVQITDAQGRVEKLGYTGDAVSSHTAADGGVTDHVFEYDDANKQFISKITGPQTEAGRRVEDLTHNRAGKLVRQIVNGRTEAEISYDTGARAETQVNARGHRTRTVRNEFDQVVRIEHPDGSTQQFSYSPLHLQPTEVVDEAGIKVRNEFDAVGNLVKRTEAVGTPDERVTVNQLNSLGQVIRSTVQGRTEVTGFVTPDVSWQFAYDEQGHLQRATDPLGQVHLLSHNRIGQLVRYTNPLGQTTQAEVDALGLITQVTDPLGRVRRYAHDKVGNLTGITDAKGQTAQAGYDALNRRTSITHALGGIYKVQYNGQGLPVAVTDEDGRGRTSAYDNFLRLVRETDGAGNATDFDYNVADGTASGVLGSLSEPTEARYPGLTLRQRFDERGRLTLETTLNPTQSGTVVLNSARSVDTRGRVKAETDAYGKQLGYAYNAFGQLTEITDRLGNKTRADHDARGNLIRLTDALGRATRFEFDAMDRLVKEIRPMGQTTTYEHDAAGRFVAQVDPMGNRMALVRDTAGRITARQYHRGSSTRVRNVGFTWDEEDRLIAWQDEDLTRPTGQQSTSATLTYDELGRKTGETLRIPNPAGGTHTLSHGYTYSQAGKKTRLTWPDGTPIDYAYSAHGELQQVSVPGEGTITISEFTWTQPSKLTLPGGTTQERRWDGLQNLESLKVRAPNQQTLLDLGMGYGKLQELKSVVRTDVIGTASASRSIAYSYDDEVRLAQVNTDTGGLFGTSTETFTLDAVANRVAHSAVSGAWSHDANHRLTQRGSGSDGVAFTYDDAGNLTKKTEANGRVTQYSHDTANRLVAVRDGSNRLIARYGHDPLNRRIWREQYRDAAGNALASPQRSYYAHADEGLLAEAVQPIALQADESVSATAAPVMAAQYGLTPDAPFTTEVLFTKALASNGQPMLAWFQHDQQRKPVQAVSSAGAVVWAAAYDAFGRATVLTAPSADRVTLSTALRLPGQVEDPETGLHQNLNRYYDPTLGRYLQADPIGLLGGVNTYAYVGGDPINLSDPQGLWAASFGAAFGPGFQFTFGKDGKTGRGFIDFKIGWGVSATLKFDPLGGLPYSLPEDCGRGGIGVRAFGELGKFQAGPIDAKLLDAKAGYNFDLFNDNDPDFRAQRYAKVDQKAQFQGKTWGLDAKLASGGVGFTVYSGKK